MKSYSWGCKAFVCLAMSSAPLFAAQIDFETVPLGTSFGSNTVGDFPGRIVLSQDSIDLSVENFFEGTFVGFDRAEIGGIYGEFFATTPLGLDNISARFDFSRVGFSVTEVTLEYQEFGGVTNFAVNDGPILELLDIADIPLDVAPGVQAIVGHNTITLLGDIHSFQIGGQELAVDTIVAVPEPTTLALLALGGLAFLRRKKATAP